MRAASIAFTLSGFVVAGVFVACATGGDAASGDTGGDGTGGDTDSGVGAQPASDSGYNPYGSTPDGSFDSGFTAKDSGGGGKVDSGGGADSGGGGGNTDCTGTQGMQLNVSYNKECANYFLNSGFKKNPCTPGGNDCSPLGDGTVMCCYEPDPGSSCDIYYKSNPQCVPK